MTEAELWGICGAGVIGIGLYGAILGRSGLRRLLAFNLVGSGVFLIFGVIGRRGGVASGVASDPVPQALVITGLVVAFAATALAVALLLRLAAARLEDSAADSGADAPADPKATADAASDGTGAG
jgi:multicomponent Na+:H+ antiporter subunit C